MATSIDSLPQHTLHHILSLLSQKEAVQTSLLSKSWRHLWYGRPKVEFCECEFTNQETTFVSVVDNTLQRYLDQKLPLKELCLKISENKTSVRLLEKWIPVIMLRSLAVEVIELSFLSESLQYCDMPFSVFSKSESLKEVTLEGYNLTPTVSILSSRYSPNPNPFSVLFKHLQQLFLKRVYIADETLEKITTSCPLIERVYLENCEGLKTIKLISNKHLEVFILVDLKSDDNDCCSIDIYAPKIIGIVIAGCWNWFNHHNYFPYLKSLILQEVKLSTSSLDIFSSNLPCLEKLTLSGTYGFEQFQLSSRSIRSLAIQGLLKSIKVIIDAPNILYFEYSSFFLPSSFSFGTTAGHDWKSKICVNLKNDHASSTMLTILLKAVSLSQISLDLVYDPLLDWDIADISYGDGYNIQRVITVEHLVLIQDPSSNSISDSLINVVFRIFRPRYTYAADAEHENVDVEIIKSLSERLVHGSSKMSDHNCWQRDLEQASIEASEDNGKQWHLMLGPPECAFSTGQKIRFRLTWRES